MAERPLSPHLSVYRMYRYSVLSSISNRFAGVALSMGLIVLVYWLMAIAGGPDSYARSSAILSSVAFKAVFLILLGAFSYHLVAGIRHLVWDTGRGMERSHSQRSAWLVGILSLLLFAGLAWWLLAGAGGVR